MDVLICGPFQLIAGFPIEDVDVQLGCSTTMVPKCPTERLDLFLNNPEAKANFNLQHYVSNPTPTTLVPSESLSTMLCGFKRTPCLSLSLWPPGEFVISPLWPNLNDGIIGEVVNMHVACGESIAGGQSTSITIAKDCVEQAVKDKSIKVLPLGPTNGL